MCFRMVLLGVISTAIFWACQPAVHHSQTPIEAGSSQYLKGNSVRIAYIGDSGSGPGFADVLRLIRANDPDLVVHLGDLGYDEGNSDSAKEWFNLVQEHLPANTPYIAAIGNHDVKHWSHPNIGYRDLLEGHLKNHQSSDFSCSYAPGEYGVKTVCQIGPVSIVVSGVGTAGEGHTEFLETSLANEPDTQWKVCAWHKNQRDMQTGSKGDEVGWQPYQTCQAHGAMIVTGHEHAYARTFTLNDIGNRNREHGKIGLANQINLGPGRSFVVVSGIGGITIRKFSCLRHRDDSWWASVVTSNYGLTNGQTIYGSRDCFERTDLEYFGALFIDYSKDDLSRAKGRFLTTSGDMFDEFDLVKSP